MCSACTRVRPISGNRVRAYTAQRAWPGAVGGGGNGGSTGWGRETNHVQAGKYSKGGGPFWQGHGGTPAGIHTWQASAAAAGCRRWLPRLETKGAAAGRQEAGRLQDLCGGGGERAGGGERGHVMLAHRAHAGIPPRALVENETARELRAPTALRALCTSLFQGLAHRRPPPSTPAPSTCEGHSPCAPAPQRPGPPPRSPWRSSPQTGSRARAQRRRPRRWTPRAAPPARRSG